MRAVILNGGSVMAIVAAMTIMSCSSASAQTTAASSAQDAPISTAPKVGAARPTDANPEVVVTASRINRPGFTAPTPVTSVSAADIQKRAPTTVGEILADIPSFRPTSTPNTSGVNSLGGGQVTADLRGLGADRTLVLVDGRRFVPTTSSGTVDLKLIPTLLVDQVQVVTGGASAAWGSDAVAGVVNFIMKKDIQGLQGTAQYGESQAGDDQEWKLSLATGGKGLNDRLHYTVGMDYLDNLGIGDQYTRAWGRKEYGLITNPNYATNGLPNYIISPNVHQSGATEGGVIVSGPLKNIAFGPGGVPYAFQPGQVFGTSMIGGTEEGKNPTLAANLGSPLQSLVSMGHVSYEVTPKITAFIEGSVDWSYSGGASQQPRDTNLTIASDNAYLPPSIAAQMKALGLSSIAIGRTDDDTGKEQLSTNDDTYRIVGGLDGDISGSWKWSAYYQYGLNSYRLQFGPNNRIKTNFALATDAVVNPANGQIVCRSTLTNPGNGCIPENVFGNGSETVNGYSFGTARYDLTTEEQVASANIQGDVITLPAGPVSLVTGFEYRQERGTAHSDALSLQPQVGGSVGAFYLGDQPQFSGQYDTKEWFAETDIPIAKGLPFMDALDLNGAGRVTDYSTSGTVETWKMGFNYSPVHDLRFRGALSQDIRAPNLSDLYIGGTASSFTNVFDTVRGSTVQVQQVPEGNINLQPEVARTKTLGFVYRPSWLSGLGLTVDYYDIRVAQVIGSIGAPQLVAGCAAGVKLYCSSIVFNADHTINYVISQELNLDSLATDGVDLEADYRISASSLINDLPGSFNFRGLGTYVDKLVTTDPAGVHNYIGQVSNFNRVAGVPHWTGVFDLSYEQPRWLVDLQTRIIGAGIYAAGLTTGTGAANTINNNNVPAVAYLALTGQYNFTVRGARLQLYGVIDNLLDTAPPYVPSGAAGGTNESSTNSVFYDVIGRLFKVGLRFQY